mmetsp:Transcript_94616/g.276565  ORF Transcript_94616/g.276565 Transcript_94616/m.276565 type:complete len:216 (-) Transcript_94616:264-911(-)
MADGMLDPQALLRPATQDHGKEEVHREEHCVEAISAEIVAPRACSIGLQEEDSCKSNWIDQCSEYDKLRHEERQHDQRHVRVQCEHACKLVDGPYFLKVGFSIDCHNAAGMDQLRWQALDPPHLQLWISLVNAGLVQENHWTAQTKPSSNPSTKKERQKHRCTTDKQRRDSRIAHDHALVLKLNAGQHTKNCKPKTYYHEDQSHRDRQGEVEVDG